MKIFLLSTLQVREVLRHVSQVVIESETESFEVLAEASFLVWLHSLRSRLNVVKPIAQRLQPAKSFASWFVLSLANRYILL